MFLVGVHAELSFESFTDLLN